MRHDHEFKAVVETNVSAAVAEDVGSGDITAGLLPDLSVAAAQVITREDGVFCGVPWVAETCRQIEPRIELDWHVHDGEDVRAGQPLLELVGPARGLLTAERTLLNFAQLLSGVATKTRRYVDLIRGTSTTLLDTRKTVPGLRFAQKYAVRCGGGENHRMGLFDAFLIKENHIVAAGSISSAVAAARGLDPEARLEVEVESFAELDEALRAGADLIMLDNFSLGECAEAVSRTRGKAKLEASGGIDEASLAAIAGTGVDYVSVGCLAETIGPPGLSIRFLGGA